MLGPLCDYCGEHRSMVYCQTDSAFFCFSCDRNVHSANSISRRHTRTLLCDRCASQPAMVRCLEENASLCQNCDWNGHPAGSSAAGHKRQNINCYSGCPSSAQLSRVWSFISEIPDAVPEPNYMANAHDELEKKLQGSNGTPMSLPLEFLKDITSNFSTKSVLGEGGYGVVYKGVLRCGKIIAVKKLFEIRLKEETFQNEVCFLMDIKHQNVVELIGYCAESRWEAIEYPSGCGKLIFAEIPQRLLCFEYISNKSLDKHISDESLGLEWNMRYEIIKGICNGLYFLHEECRIVHLDLKPENILMDSIMTPKIADFGLSRIIGKQQSRIVTDNHAGTCGYMAPEYLTRGIVSNKADIFSLGVIIIEIITGHRDYPFFWQDSPDGTSTSLQQFTEKVLVSWGNRLLSIPKCKSMERDIQQVRQCIDIALNCVDPSMEKRPTAKDISQILNAVDQKGTMMNSTQDPAGRRPSTIQRQLVRDASGNVHASEERDDAHYSFLQVKKGSVLVTRMESITAYKNQHGQHRSGTQEQSDTHVSANDMCALDEWPSHARRNRPQLQNESDGQKKKGRGVLKGFKATKKHFANGSAKLNIAFSENLGGIVGMNYRSFKDDVVVIMKRKLPLIGVRRWSDIHPTIHRLIVADMMDRWDLEDTPETEEKILKIAKERYRGWRSTLSSTYKAYKTDAARLANVPEDLQPEEWEWMIEYFGSDSKFQKISQKNSDNRKKQKTKHRIGSKSYSQLSFEKRDLETGEEPDCIALWELTHTKNGTWSNKESQDVYDKACQEVQNKENETQGPVSSEHRSNIF